MHTDLPAELRGNHPLANWSRKLLRAVRRRTPLEGFGYKLRQTENGFTQEILARGGGGGESSPIRMAFLASVTFDEMTCIDPDSPATSIRIAKPYKLRQHASQVIDSTTLTYTYVSGVERNAFQAGLFLENQIILPRYQVGDPIFYAQIEEDIITDVDKIDLNVDARAWARRFV